jgi:hypothetical protein
MMANTALASIVTEAVLEEFKLLKFSFELFHGAEYRWYVRCDRTSLEELAIYPNVVPSGFADHIMERPDNDSSAFLSIMGEKMNAIEEAWKGGSCEGVVFFDSDIIVTAPIMTSIAAIDADVILTPHYYPDTAKDIAPVTGHYNAGFVYTRAHRFHEWWRDTFYSRPVRWADQACLNDIPDEFVTGALTDRANIGFWRSARVPEYNTIPIDCEFLHTHLYQPLRTADQWIYRTFSLHCLKFLRQSHIPEHNRIFLEALALDKARWYEASLRLC